MFEFKKIQLSSDIRELVNNSLLSLIGSVISKGLLFIAWLMVAKILGKEGNGEVGIIRSTLNLFVIFVGSGISLTATKYIPEFLVENRRKVNRILSITIITSISLGIILSALLFFTAPFIAEEVLNAPNLSTTLKISSFLLLLSSISSMLSGCLQGFKGFKDLMIINCFYGLSLLIFLYFGATHHGLEGTFIGFTLSTLILVILGIIFLKRQMTRNDIHFTFKFKKEYRILIKFTIPAIMTGLMVIPFKWLVDTILVNSENGFNNLGLYSAVLLFQSLLLMSANTLNAPLITLMAKGNISKSIDKISLIIPWAIGIFACIPILFFSDFFGNLLGQEYVSDISFRPTIFIVMLTSTIMLYKQGLARIMIVNDLMWFSFISNLIWGVVLLSSFYFFSVKNSETLSISYLIAYLVNTIIVFPVYMKKNIIPISLVKSKESILIWIFFFILVIIVYSFPDMGIVFDLVFLFSGLLIFSVLFFRLFFIKE